MKSLRLLLAAGAALLAGLLPLLLAGAAQAQVLHTEKSLYRDIVVYQEDGLRCMRFGRYAAARQTCMQVADSNRIVFDYARMMMAALYLNAAPRRILIIGVGGGTLPMALTRVLPEAHIDAVEIDPAVIRVARRFFNFKEAPRLRALAEDGRVFVKRAKARGEKYDLVMLDAFDHEYIPEHLLTRDFFLEVKSILTERGVLAANTFTGSRLYHHESVTYHAAFGDFFSLKRANRVILWRNGGLPDKTELARNAAAVETRLAPMGAPSAGLLPELNVEAGWPADTRVLTDQYSPSNLLNAR